MRDLGVKLAMISFSVLVGALLVEIGLRVVGISFPLFYHYDEVRGSALRAGAHGWYRREGNGYVSINSDGLRDREHARTKPAGTYRIALVGDSMAESLQVNLDQTFFARMETELAGCPALGGRTPEVINFGSSGYNTTQEMLTVRDQVLAYQPDLVMLLFTSWNDLRDNVMPPGAVPEAPCYQLAPDGTLVLDNSFRDTPRFRRGSSLLVRVLHGLVNYSRVIQVAHQGWLLARGGDSFGHSQDPGLEPNLYREPDPAWAERWRVTEALLALMNRTVTAGGARFVVAISSTAMEVHPDPAVRAEFARKINVPDLFYMDHRFEQVGARDGYPVIALAPLLRQDAEREHAFVHGFANSMVGVGHYNLDGHRFAGHHLAEQVCTLVGQH